MSIMKPTFLAIASLALAVTPTFSQTYKVTGSIPIGGTGGWDYLTVDSDNHRVYVSHGSEVAVVDSESQKVVGHISGMQRIHGIAVAADLGTGFISDGGTNEVVCFDLKTLAVKSKVKTGTNPDGIVYDAASKRVFTFNGRSNDSTAIDATSLQVAGTVKLGGRPEFPVSDGKGNLYANIEDKNEIVHIDPKNLTVQARWPLQGCESPSGLAMDRDHRRLFTVCDGKKMNVGDADSGKVVAAPAIGDGPDAAGFDPGKKLAFSSNGEDGTLTVIKEEDPNTFKVVQTVKTATSARTMALDEKTHKIYLAAATLGPPPAATAANPHPWPSVVPNTFKLLVVAP